MRFWLPSIWIGRVVTTDPGDPSIPDAHGIGVTLRWLGLILEFGAARIKR